MLALVAIVFGFGALPPEIAVRFDAIGQATHVATAEALLRLPLVGLVLALVNAALGVVLHPAREAACSAAVDRRRRRTRHRVRGCRSSAPVTDTAFADLIRLIDELEGRAEGYLTLPEVEAAGGQQVDAAIEASILLVDHRTRLDVTSGELASVTLCRLNRQHPLVQELTSW